MGGRHVQVCEYGVESSHPDFVQVTLGPDPSPVPEEAQGRPHLWVLRNMEPSPWTQRGELPSGIGQGGASLYLTLCPSLASLSST